MAGTIYVRDAIWRVSSLLQDVSPQFTRWPETEIVNWLNDAQLAVSKFLPAANSRVVPVKFRPGTKQSIRNLATTDFLNEDGTEPTSPLIGTMMLDVIRNMGADGLTPGNAIRILADGREVLDSQRPNWHTLKGTSIKNYMFDPRTPCEFFVSPGADDAVDVWAELALVAQPTKIPNTGTAGAELYLVDGTNTTPISMSDEHIDDLVNYVCARAYMKNAQFAGNGPNAQAYTALFLGSINAKVAALTGNNPNLQRLPLAPEPLGQAS